MAEAVSPHEAAFEAQFDYMVGSIDAGSLAPACATAGLINDRQREECFRESSSFKKAELLLGYVKRSITGDGAKFDTFVAILRRTGHSRQADILAQHVTNKQSSGGAAAGAQSGTSQVSASEGSAYNMITPNIPSSSASTQTNTSSHDQFSFFSNQPSSRYPIPPNLLPYNPFPPYFLPVQQPVLPPSYHQAYLSSYPNMLQQWNDPSFSHMHAPSGFPFPPNPVHLNQQYSVLPSHTNTPILHQNPSLSCKQHPLPPHFSGTPHPYDHRLNSQPFPLYSSTDPNSVTTAAATATSNHSLNPPDVHSLTSPFSSMTTSPENTLKYTHSDSTIHSSNAPCHTEQSSYQQSFPSDHPRQSCYTCDSTITAYNSLAPPSPSATTSSGVTASPSTPAHQHPLSPAMQRYVTYVKNVYKNITTPVYDKEHSLLQVKAKSFINIALVHKDSPQYSDKKYMLMDRLHGHVDAIQRNKTKLLIHDVCKSQDGRLARSVLVEGAPGVGKTTFANELCKRWARGEILWKWAAVVLIKLRDHTTRTAQNMNDLLYHPRPEVQQAVVDQLIDHDGACMLLILDGYDELTDSQKKSTSVIQQIMSKKLLCQSTLMVTSRPLATRTLHNNFVQSIDQHIEVLGFTEKNIEEYIQSACGDKPKLVEDFTSYLSSHPFSSALMFNPLQCAIVTDLYCSHWEHGDKGFAPKTLTELYTGLVHIMLVRYLTHHPIYKDGYWWITDLTDLPEEVCLQLKAVTELAATGIRKQQYVFDEVNTNIPLETLGLMQKEEVVASGIGISASHNFLHLTLQEYLAAVNYSQQYNSPEQLSQLLTRADLFPLNNFLQYYGMKREPTLYSSATHWPVVLFVAGRTKLSGVPTNIFKTGLHDSDDDDGITTVDVSLLHLLYETQSPQLIQSTLVTSRKYLSVSGSSALDWFVIGYCIANSTSTWRVEKKDNDILKHFDQLVMGLRLGPEECSREYIKIGSLHISGNWTGNLKTLSQLRKYAKKATNVGNERREQRDPENSKRKSVSHQEVSAGYPMLEKCATNNTESNYSVSLLSFISQHSNLHSLSLNQCNLSSIATSSLIHFLQSPNNRLNELTLEDCTIQIPDHTNSVAISYEMKSISPIDTKNFSLEITGSLYAINYILSKPHLFYTNTLTILKVAIVSETTDSLQTTLYPNLLTLKVISVSKENAACLHSFPFSPHENNLCTLSLQRCHLSNKCVSSLIHFLQSPNNRLHKLTLNDCTIQIPDHTNPVAISYQIDSISPTDTGNFSLKITGSLYAINYMLSQPRQFYANTLTILKVVIMSETTDSLQIDTSFYPDLNKLDITSKEENRTLLHDSVFYVISQQNSLHILSLQRCKLTYSTVRSLIHSLQSSQCELQVVTLDDCIYDHTHTTTASSKLKMKSLDSGNVSLEFTGVCNSCDISHWLSQHSSYTQLTELILYLKRGDSTTTVSTLQEIRLYYHVLESLKIEMDRPTAIALPLSIPQFIELQENNLHNLSLRECNFSSDITWSLIHSLQSPHCKLYKLTMSNCKILTHDKTQLKRISTITNATLCSLVVTDSLCVLNHIFSNVLFSRMTDLNLSITCSSSEADVLTTIYSSCPFLETVKIYSETLPLSILQFIESKQNNLNTLSLSRSALSTDVTRSLIHSLQSPNCRLQKLSLKSCIISLPHDDTQQTTILTKMIMPLNSLDISWSVLDQLMSCINPFTKYLTELILHVDNDTHTCTSGVETILQEIPTNCPLLETLKIDCVVCIISITPAIPQFIGSQQNNIHTVSLWKCKLSSDVTRSLIHSLWSPHCKLYKLALYDCTIPTTDHTQLTTAIVSSTTITHLLFIDRNIDTPSLTALSSGLKHNTTIEQLAVDKFPMVFTEDQFQVLIDAVDSSAVKKLWLYDYYKYEKWFNGCTLSRKNIDIKWYSNYYMLYNKWWYSLLHSVIR